MLRRPMLETFLTNHLHPASRKNPAMATATGKVTAMARVTAMVRERGTARVTVTEMATDQLMQSSTALKATGTVPPRVLTQSAFTPTATLHSIEEQTSGTLAVTLPTGKTPSILKSLQSLAQSPPPPIHPHLHPNLNQLLILRR